MAKDGIKKSSKAAKSTAAAKDHLEDQDPFMSLWQLLDQGGERPKTLAPLVEQFGVNGWDRFGRFVVFAPGSEEAARVLDSLAAYYRWRYCGDPQPELLDRTLLDHGWLVSTFPTGSQPALVGPDRPEPRPSSVRMEENATLGLVFALHCYIKGGVTGNPHPDYKGDPALIAELGDLGPGVPGVSRNTVSGKFDRAEEAYGKVNWKV